MTTPLDIKAEIKLLMPATGEQFFEYLKTNATHARPSVAEITRTCTTMAQVDRILRKGNVIRQHENDGKTVVICGAGPSLKDHHDWLRKTPAHQVWAANSAVNYLVAHDLPVTHAVTVDGSAEMFEDAAEWQHTHDVTYLVASGVHPGLIPHLKAQGRRFRLFHSYLGMKNPEGWVPPPEYAAQTARERARGDTQATDDYELFLYRTMYPSTARVGYGLNSVPRAVCLALWSGFKKVYVVGADCACSPNGPLMPPTSDGYADWLDRLSLYADGRTPRKYGDRAILMQTLLNGVVWHTRPDMVVSAKHLILMERMWPAVELIGNTLPNALKRMPDDYLEKLPGLDDGTVTNIALQNKEWYELQERLLTTTAGR